MHDPRLRRPISTRHAFALAFDLAVRRDSLQSLIVPVLLRSPWVVALALLPPLSEAEHPEQVMLLSSAALVGDFLMLLIVSAMLRFRARSVFNTPPEVHPEPALACYAHGLRRVPWLVVTEIVRNLTLLFGAFFLVLPGIFLGFRLAFATEAVVLNEPHLSGAFQRSFRITQKRLERWFEMVVLSAMVVLTVVFLGALLSVLVPGPSVSTWVAVTWLLITAVMPVVQYAWTFFYLRLVELDQPAVEVGPLYAHRAAALPAEPAFSGTGSPPHLVLVEPPRQDVRPPDPERGI
jgi:hypothetical protein